MPFRTVLWLFAIHTLPIRLVAATDRALAMKVPVPVGLSLWIGLPDLFALHGFCFPVVFENNLRMLRKPYVLQHPEDCFLSDYASTRVPNSWQYS
jgi:hypothetical protein